MSNKKKKRKMNEGHTGQTLYYTNLEWIRRIFPDQDVWNLKKKSLMAICFTFVRILQQQKFNLASGSLRILKWRFFCYTHSRWRGLTIILNDVRYDARELLNSNVILSHQTWLIEPSQFNILLWYVDWSATWCVQWVSEVSVWQSAKLICTFCPDNCVSYNVQITDINGNSEFYQFRVKSNIKRMEQFFGWHFPLCFTSQKCT